MRTSRNVASVFLFRTGEVPVATVMRRLLTARVVSFNENSCEHSTHREHRETAHLRAVQGDMVEERDKR